MGFTALSIGCAQGDCDDTGTACDTGFESEGDPDLSEIADYIYDERNIGMLEHIESYLTQPETTTVMVGALHLGGPRGLINLLTEKGYLVQQLNQSGEPL